MAMSLYTELHGYRNYRMLNRMPSGQISLYFTLLDIANFSRWQGWFAVSNSMLCELAGLGRSGLVSARAALVGRNLINYRKGHANQAGSYLVCSVQDAIAKAAKQKNTVISFPMETIRFGHVQDGGLEQELLNYQGDILTGKE